MTFQVITFDNAGRQIGNLGQFGNVASARQAMLDDSNTVELPTEAPFHLPSSRVVEGWFVGRTEYHILQVTA